MIADFDTSAIVPLIVDEPTTETCNRLWNEATRVVCVRLIYPESRAALARAERLGRLTPLQLREAVAERESIIDEIDLVEIGPDLARDAGDLAEHFGLRGYDAVHLAAALAVNDDDVVLVTGDRELATAARAAGLATTLTEI